MQEKLLNSEKFVRIVSAPTGSGKSYGFVKAAIECETRILFIVPTKRLLQNLCNDARDQAKKHLQKQGWSEEKIISWINQSIVEWSANQTREEGRRITVTRVRQIESPEIKIIFAIPETVVSVLSRSGSKGTTALNPFMYVRWFDHIVFDEFHTIDDRSFGLASLLALLASDERWGKVSLLSATPVKIRKVLEGVGIPMNEVEEITEDVVSGHPKGNRLIHGDVEVCTQDLTLLEILENQINSALESIKCGYTVILIYDSLKRLKEQERYLRDVLQNSGISNDRILSINSIDDSKRRHGSPNRGHLYRDPRNYDVLICTSSVEIGVSFKSNFMLMEPGHNISSFCQRVGRVSRGEYAGKVIVSCPSQRRNRHRWVKKMAKFVERNKELDVQTFTDKILSDVRSQIEPNLKKEDSDVEYFRNVSWRGAFWAGLFIEAIISTKMNVQKEARERLKKLRGKKIKLISAKIEQIRRVDTVNDNISRKAQPHKEWINALFTSALTYRDIGSTLTVIDPDGTKRTVREAFLRRATSILRSNIQEEEEGETVVRLRSKTLDQEIENPSSYPLEHRLRLFVQCPIGGKGFFVLIREHDRQSEYLNKLIIEEWKDHYFRLISKTGGESNSPQQTVILAATKLIELLGKPPLEEDFEDSCESAIFA